MSRCTEPCSIFDQTLSDLGRFGLGMKSASLSQCKRLTVISKSKGETSAYRWDYDEVSKKSNNGKWFVLKLDPNEIENLNCFEELDNTKQFL